jgi:hypothetical protein
VPPDVADVGEVAQQLAHDRLGPAAERALEIAVLDHGDGRVDGATDVVALRTDVDVEIDDRLGGPEQRADARPPRQERRRAEEQPRECGRRRGRTEDAELGLLQLVPVEGERRDEQRNREADACDRPAAGDGDPSHRRLEPASAQPRGEPRAAEDSDRLAGDVAEDDAERDRRREGAREEVTVERDARVRECEQRHDHVARQRVPDQLEALVRRSRDPHLFSRYAAELGRRLFAELSEPLRRARAPRGAAETPRRADP